MLGILGMTLKLLPFVPIQSHLDANIVLKMQIFDVDGSFLLVWLCIRAIFCQTCAIYPRRELCNYPYFGQFHQSFRFFARSRRSLKHMTLETMSLMHEEPTMKRKWQGNNNLPPLNLRAAENGVNLCETPKFFQDDMSFDLSISFSFVKFPSNDNLTPLVVPRALISANFSPHFKKVPS